MKRLQRRARKKTKRTIKRNLNFLEVLRLYAGMLVK